MPLTFTPHDYQQAYHADVVSWLATTADPHNPKEARRLYASPTGTGKSVMELMTLEAYATYVLVTPRLGIITGMLEKLGIDSTGWSDEKLAEVALEHRITTPVRFRNMLAKGTFPFQPPGVIIDEGHHAISDVHKELAAYLPNVVWIALTATPFRGTPKGTKELLDEWNGVIHILTIAQAVARGCLSVPVPQVWPLVDDDTVTIQNGEFVVAALDAAITKSLDEIVSRCKGLAHREYLGATTWRRPTLFACPTRLTCEAMAEKLNDAGLPASIVIQDTPRHERNEIFARAMRGETAVVQIDVVSEGVDLPFRVLVDLRPTMSPVKWMQQIGRTARPIPRCNQCLDIIAKRQHTNGPCRCPKPREADPEYYCTNRNLERHGYLFNGAMPPQYIADAQQAFPKPTVRVAARAFGLENLGRFAAAEVALADGCIASLYNIVSTDAYAKTEYAAMVHPAVADVLYARRVSTRGKDGEFQWGKWKAIDGMPDIQGYASAVPKAVSPKQAAWWARSAERFGLDPRISKVNRKNFAVLPLLKDLNFKLGGGR